VKVLNKRIDVIPLDAIYVGRPSKWGNPYQIGIRGTREDVIQLYREDIEDAIACNPYFLEELKGRDLVCWCHNWDGQGVNPNYCHADVLLELANIGDTK